MLKMRKIVYFICLLLSCVINAQVVIGNEVPIESSSILEFSVGKKGIILPKVDILDPEIIYASGTFLMDKNDKRVKIFIEGNWLEISDEGSLTEITSENTGYPLTTAVVINDSEEIGGGMVISDTSSETYIETVADGILVLESDDKALVLPHVADPHLNIPKPVAGTMCYDTVSNSLAIFDGVVWNYWK